MASIWERDGEMPAYPAIDADQRTETLVIGGGMTGLLCGHFLREQNGEYLILEKDRIAGGVTKNTTAKLTWQHGRIYTKLRRAFGTEGAAAYLAAGTQALDAYGRIVREREIACGYEKKNNFVYGLTSVEKADLIEEAETIRCLGGPGLHEPGRRALYRPLFQTSARGLCGQRLQQMGHDRCHGGGAGPDRTDGPGDRQGVPARPDHAAAAALCQRVHVGEEPFDPWDAQMHPHGLRSEVEPAGAQLGLSVPRVSV